MDETPPCKTDPRAPHGFDRNASHSAGRYVCECEGWQPQPEPPPECQTEEEKTAFAFGWWKAMETKRQWVGLSDEDYSELLKGGWEGSLIREIEEKLREKNMAELTDEELERELPAEAFGELSPVWEKRF